jgi:hypothetical protein
VLLSPEIIEEVSTLIINLPHDIKKPETQKTVELMIKETLRRFDGGKNIPLMDPINEMEIESKDLDLLVDRTSVIKAKMEKIKPISDD